MNVAPAAVNPALLEEIKSILRRDLKLGADAQVADDMPLIGGEMDLDSLDILLLISSIEKHFQIKIPSEVIGRWAFQNVSTLTRFVQENRGALSSANRNNSAIPARDWLDLLPHGPEFRFVSQVREVSPGKSASGLWSVSGAEWFFKAHFPGNPIVPGVLMIEALAQIAGLAASEHAQGQGGGMLAHADVKFERPIVPPASIELSATVTRTIGLLRMCDVIASVAGQPAVRGAIAIRVAP